MRVFKNADDLYFTTLHHLVGVGGAHESRDGLVYSEVLGCAIGLQSVDQNFVTHEGRNLSPAYASAEILWYLSRSDNASMLIHYAPQYKRLVCENGYDYGAYGWRIANNVGLCMKDVVSDQLVAVVQMLKQDPNSRQAVVALWRPDDQWHAKMRDVNGVPCTLTWQFLLRSGRLHMVVNMRSNDAWLGMPYDIYAFTTIQRLVAGELGVETGTYAHFVGSLHLYERDAAKALTLLRLGPVQRAQIHGLNGKMLGAPLTHEYHTVRGGLSGLDQALKMEEVSRCQERKFDFSAVKDMNDVSMSQVLADAAMTCVAHNNDTPDCFAHSPLLRKAYHDHRRRKRQGRQDDSVRNPG